MPPGSSGAADRTGFAEFLTRAYDSAFHSVLWGLAAVGLVPAALIAVLLRAGRRPAD
ncbi:hypothetical protein AB0A71_01560 [Kitasatospora aureofaciens]|uniref:hypothetical protein n=1 Tax=Kitasatospora aureofaciens TaxID=1894 RepID=UPI0033CE210E